MTTITLVEAQANLKQILDRLGPGEEVLITESDRPVARIIAESKPTAARRKLGFAKGMISYIADDFDAPLDDLKEYME